MTDEQKAAMAWLGRALLIEECKNFGTPDSDKHRATIKAMLAEPRLPQEPTPEALHAMAKLHRGALYMYQWEEVYQALYAHLTKPATKTVEVWRVEYVRDHASLTEVVRSGPRWAPAADTHLSLAEAERSAAVYRDGNMFACIRVTGPHKQEVPC